MRLGLIFAVVIAAGSLTIHARANLFLPFAGPGDSGTTIAATNTTTPTSTATPTPTSTATPTVTATSPAEATPTGTATPTETQEEATATPTVTPTPTATEIVAAPCGCDSDAYNCSDFATQPQAQACLDYCIGLGKGDINRLDQDGDGDACKSLPGFIVIKQ